MKRVHRAGIEVLLGLAALHLFWLSLFRRYPPPLDQLGSPFLPGVLWAALLLALRVAIADRSDAAPVPLRRRLRPGHCLDGLGRPGLALALCFLGVFFVLEERGGRVGNDGAMLYAYTRSMVIDHDLDLANEFRDFLPDKFTSNRRSEGEAAPPKPRNELATSLFWAPFFVAAHLCVLAGRWAGFSIPADGYGGPYVNAVCLGSLVWGFVGVVLAYRMARSYFGASTAAAAAIVLWISSPMLWYTVYEPSMSHSVSMMAVALFFSVWLRAREPGTAAAWWLLGLVAGIMISVQRYNVFYLTAPLLTLAGRLPAFLAEPDKTKWRRLGFSAASSGVLFLAGLTPLWIGNLALGGAWVRKGDLPSSALRAWTHPAVSEFLFSSNHGLLSWTPTASLALLGLALWLKRERSLAGSLLVTWACGVLVLSSTWDWYAGASFGSRRLTEAFPLFLFGFCRFLEVALGSPRLLVGLLCAALALWNWTLARELREGRIPAMSTFAFSDLVGRSTTRIYRILGHPFAIPANWIFAWRYGVTPDRFDDVWGHRAYRQLRIVVGSRDDAAFLGKGWSVAESGPDGSFRWSEGPESSWLISLVEAEGYRLRIVGQASQGGGQGFQRMEVVVNGQVAGSMLLSEAPSTAELLVPGPFWRRGLNEILFRYGYMVRAEDVYGGEDSRRIAVRLERLELERQ